MFKRIEGKQVINDLIIIDIPNTDIWEKIKINKNEYWFLDKLKNEAIVIRIKKSNFDKLESIYTKLENYEVIDLKHTKAIHYLVSFKKDGLNQYEWIILHNGYFINFAYTIDSKKDAVTREVDYEKIYKIINTITHDCSY